MLFIFMNKRGFIKTLEAVVSIVVVFIFILTLTRGGENVSTSEEMKNLQEGLLQGIIQTDEFRSCIINVPVGNLNDISSGNICPEIMAYIGETLPNRFVNSGKERYFIDVCDPSSTNVGALCSLPIELEGRDLLFTSAVIISADLETYNPRILRIWMW
jgi:hypothetical protein